MSTSWAETSQHQQELPEHSHSVSPALEMRDHISHGHTRWATENIMHYIFICDNRSSALSSWNTKSGIRWSHTSRRWKSSLKALLTPCKQLSRQNSTNSRAQVRWLNILSAFFWTTISQHRVIHATQTAKNLQNMYHTITTLKLNILELNIF